MTYPVYRILRFRHQWTFPRTLTWSIYGQWIGLIWIYFQHRKRKSGDGDSLVRRERRHRIQSTMELGLFYFCRLTLGLVQDARNSGRIHPKLDYMAKNHIWGIFYGLLSYLLGNRSVATGMEWGQVPFYNGNESITWCLPIWNIRIKIGMCKKIRIHFEQWSTLQNKCWQYH